ncbi:cilia- and flagella-associated protein 299-like [Anthonomus grandis grandis]|uniref:cilia- and flagella-associated protein 299-like n=1 Tax=Anthonomus grandis grandis TaxID=2921223 RepID=UPI002165FF20|nr:cilia- and flagella-associated protein 299-like [Anthonomus grandis grandis]
MNYNSIREQQKPPKEDLALVKFDTYEDYLDSLYDEKDICYLPDRETCRQIAEYGFKRNSSTYNRTEFAKKRKRCVDYLTGIEFNKMVSTNFRGGDPAQVALAIRERPNRIGLLSTIIYLSITTKLGYEISGYIDYSHSLFHKDWHSFFTKNVPIHPDKHDLGYYDWKGGITTTKSSLYFKALMSKTKGLMFQHKFDRTLIIPDPNSVKLNQGTTRSKHKSKMYNVFVLIDHIVRSRK